MTHLNKRVLPQAKEKALRAQFNRLIGSLTEDQAGLFFNNILGPEEHIMIIKRLGAVIMLSGGHSRYRVATSLAISPATADTLAARLAAGHYNQLLSVINTDHQPFQNFKDTLLSLLGTAFYLSSPQAPKDLIKRSLRRK